MRAGATPDEQQEDQGAERDARSDAHAERAVGEDHLVGSRPDEGRPHESVGEVEGRRIPVHRRLPAWGVDVPQDEGASSLALHLDDDA